MKISTYVIVFNMIYFAATDSSQLTSVQFGKEFNFFSCGGQGVEVEEVLGTWNNLEPRTHSYTVYSFTSHILCDKEGVGITV